MDYENKFGRLKGAFVEQLKNTNRADRPDRETFKRFMRGQREAIPDRWSDGVLRKGRSVEEMNWNYGGKLEHEGSPEHYWRLLLDGEIVEWKYILAFIEYMNREYGNRFKIEVVAEQIDQPQQSAFDAREPDLWSSGWDAVGRIVRSAFAIAPESHCNGDEDYRLAATILLSSYGRKRAERGVSTPDSVAIEIGLQEMGHASIRSYAAWLSSMAQTDSQYRRPVMFSVADGPDGYASKGRRVGVTVVWPLTETAYDLVRKGTISETELTPANVAIPTLHFFVGNTAEVKPSEYKNRKRISVTQWHTGMYQMATLCRLITHAGDLPRFITSPTHEDGVKRALNFGFQPTGFKHPRRGGDILEFIPSFSDGLGLLMLMALFGYQARHYSKCTR